MERLEAVVPVVDQRGEELLGDLPQGGAEPVADRASLAWFGRYETGVGQQGRGAW